jgi:hypothetical protein
MTLPVEERLPYERARFCQFLLLIMMFRTRDDFAQDQEQDQEQDQDQEHD